MAANDQELLEQKLYALEDIDEIIENDEQSPMRSAQHSFYGDVAVTSLSLLFFEKATSRNIPYPGMKHTNYALFKRNAGIVEVGVRSELYRTGIMKEWARVAIKRYDDDIGSRSKSFYTFKKYNDQSIHALMSQTDVAYDNATAERPMTQFDFDQLQQAMKLAKHMQLTSYQHHH